MSDPTIEIATRDAPAGVEIEVSDNGVGIPKENLPRIWAPFFTTKSVDLGSGLGLSISREIVERAGGTIRVESPTREGARGARFTVSLPAADRMADLPKDPSTPSVIPEPEGPRLQVLVVEDETTLARALAAEVGRLHDVVTVASGESALEVLAGRRFDVVLLDLRMPGMPGEALYERVRETDPEQARGFIFMSGIGFEPEVERFLAATGRPVLHKPFSPGRVLRLIEERRARS